MSSRRSVPHLKREDNPEHLLELQIRNRARSQAGVTAKYKKRHRKELPAATRDAIVKMYLDDHVFQRDVAKYFKVSPALVSQLVRQAKEDREKNRELRKLEE